VSARAGPVSQRVSQVDEMTPAFSLKDVSRHCSEQDAWVVVDGRVYDVSGFLPSHPGGLDVLNGHLGTDVSEILRSPDYHRHSSTAYQILEQCCIGVLKDAQLNYQVCIHTRVHYNNLEATRSYASSCLCVEAVV
jgi:cytochrome b involved in lipid metabolism